MSTRPKIVRPADFEGMSMSMTLNLFGVGPKFTIRCGNCLGTFRERIPLIDDPIVGCPYCSTLNQLPIHVS